MFEKPPSDDPYEVQETLGTKLQRALMVILIGLIILIVLAALIVGG